MFSSFSTHTEERVNKRASPKFAPVAGTWRMYMPLLGVSENIAPEPEATGHLLTLILEQKKALGHLQLPYLWFTKVVISMPYHVWAAEESDTPLQEFPLPTVTAYINYFQQPEGLYFVLGW